MSLNYFPLDRTVVRLTGDDRVSFLNNFCTADIKLLQTNQISEAFILNEKGKLLAHLFVFCHADSLELNTVAGQGETIMTHLDRYLIREDVTMTDISMERKHIFVFGDGLDAAGAVEFNQFTEGEIQAAHCEAAGVGVLGSAAAAEPLVEWASSLGATETDEAAVHLYRVRAGTPLFGTDSSSDNLPQELVRDAKAISFTKGCYLGQETVARIDALGRVNKLLVRLQSSSAIEVGGTLELEGKSVGTLSSVVNDGADWFGLAIVKRAAAKSGTVLKAGAVDVTVV